MSSQQVQEGVEVSPRGNRYVDAPGDDVEYRGHFVGSILPAEGGGFKAVPAGELAQETPPPSSRLDAIAVLARLGAERYG